MKNNIENISDNQEFCQEIDSLFENQNKLFLKLLMKSKKNEEFVAIYSKDLFIQKNMTAFISPWVGENYREELDILMTVKHLKHTKFLTFGINIIYEE